MATDQGPMVQSAQLRTELVHLRKEKGLTQEQVAKKLDWSSSKLIRIEGGKNAISRTDLQALLLQYDVTSESRQEKLQALARGAREPAWWAPYRGEFSETYLNYVGYESGASFVRHFQGLIIPGLLQTPEYAEVIASGIVGPVQVGTVVKLRMERQRRMVERENPPHRLFLIDEATIRRHVGVMVDPGIMPRQLRSIADDAERDELLTVRVVPFSVGSHKGLEGPFTILEFDSGLNDVLYLEGSRAASVLFAGDETRISDYRGAFEDLLDLSLPEDRSIEMIRDAADQLMA
ncbi:helix-turn-helix domain-containing protein [Actinomadura atramentaria]|uniref:helix-turn-helix domain-containing protein n=1 Tax=Actinomadura atramentaria TaxID=1990 RepID=UPI00036129C2|nr:helix-turn-helix transcriptional regulator [Actinomadura atramentaria]